MVVSFPVLLFPVQSPLQLIVTSTNSDSFLQAVSPFSELVPYSQMMCACAMARSESVFYLVLITITIIIFNATTMNISDVQAVLRVPLPTIRQPT